MSLVTLVIELLLFLDLTIHLLIVPTLQHFQFSWGFHYFYHSHINWKVNCFHRSHRLTFQQLFQHFHFTFLSACTSIQTSNFTNCALHLKWNFQHLHCELLIHLVSRVNFQQHATVHVFHVFLPFIEVSLVARVVSLCPHLQVAAPRGLVWVVLLLSWWSSRARCCSSACTWYPPCWQTSTKEYNWRLYCFVH